jgi:hypothetical protein
MAARKLRHYFEGHRIRVITNQPLKDSFTNKEASTQIIKLGAELSEYTVDFEKRSMIKSQVLPYIVVDWTSPTQNLDKEIPMPWIVQCDGAWCHKGVGISAVVTSLWLRCITSEKGIELLKEVHSGFCGAHIGTRALAGKAIKQGFYWPTINIDAKTLVRQCQACPKIANQQNLPSMPVHLIPPSWPLQRWRMDLVGPLPTTQGSCRFAAVTVDYFTKWVEAKPLTNIKAPTIQKFFCQSIICRFGDLRELTIDNGTQFDHYTFKVLQVLGDSGEILISISSAI